MQIKRKRLRERGGKFMEVRRGLKRREDFRRIFLEKKVQNRGRQAVVHEIIQRNHKRNWNHF
eukprot:4780356-Karenia_brevis.AAC.1